MNIRKRLTVTFTIITAFITFILCFIVYQTSQNSRQELFRERLLDRLEISEKFYLESNSLSTVQKEELKNRFMQSLTHEVEFAFTLDSAASNFKTSKSENIPENIVEKSVSGKPVFWKKEKREGVAKRYQVQGNRYIVVVLATDIFGWSFLEKLKNILIIGFIMSILISALLSRAFARQALKPIAHKINKANSISTKNLNQRLTVYNPNDELGMLAISFNELLDRIQFSFELQKNFVRYASHELRNPLAVILGETELTLSKERSTNEYVSTIQKTNLQAEKLNTLVTHFLNLSKFEEKSNLLKEEVRMDEVLMSALIEINQVYQGREITFRIDVEDEDLLLIEAEKDLLQTAFSNVIDNACKYSTRRVDIRVFLAPELTVEISDLGIGIDNDEIDKIFEPLYRSKNSSEFEGSGIGLSMVKKIIELHAGKVTVQSIPQTETIFTISFS